MKTSPTINGGVRQWRRYKNLKASGFSWLGDVPAHWQVKRLKHVCQMNPSKSEIRELADDLMISFLPMEKVHEQGGLDLDFHKPLGVLRQGFTYFRDGDVLVAKITPCFENGKGALASGLENGIGMGTTELHVLRPLPEVDARFLELVTRQHSFRRLGCMSMTGAAGQQRVSEAFISNFVFGLPPLDEQRRIVAFLDWQTAKIDALIAKKERLIELLQEKRTALISHAVTKGLDPTVPMKDSGVEWVRQIPTHWSLRRNGFLFHDRDERGYPDLPILEVSIHTGVNVRQFSDEHVEQKAEDPTTYKRTLKGDLAFNKMRMWQGAVGVTPVDGLVSPDYQVCRPRLGVHARYFEQLFRTSVYMTEINRYSHGIVKDRNRLYWDQFKEMPSLLPPSDEQVRIIEYTDEITVRIGRLIAKVRDGIEKLREYRTALISAAVTGKIDISIEAGTKVESKVVPEKPATKPNPYFRRTVFAAEIIDRLCDDPTFGHVKFQKCLFVTQHHLRVEDFEENYKRMAAGPYDNALIYSVESQVAKQHWFKAEKVGDRYTYRRLDKAGGHKKYFDGYFGDRSDQLAKLLDLFRLLDTDRAEIVATLYAVWNDFLIRGETCDDDRIVAEVLTNWHGRKKRFDENRWRKALTWMREKGLVPTGFGKPTVLGDGADA